MNILGVVFFSFFFIYTYTALCIDICNPSSCGNTGPLVRFPFRLKYQQVERCGYPGFDLSCNNQSQRVLHLPSSGEFIVKRISYSAQSIYINDPDSCLPKRILTFSLLGSQFRGAYLRDFTFLNCSSNSSLGYIEQHTVRITCLSDDNYTVLATSSPSSIAQHMPSSCRDISTVSVPLQSSFSHDWSYMDLDQDLQLVWDVPRCLACEAERGICGFKRDTGLEIGCFKNLPSRVTGLPRTAKYGVIIGIGIPVLVCLIGLACYTCSRFRAYNHSRHLITELSTATSTPQSRIVMAGLDGPTIESYPKTVLGASRRLPKPNESTCPICLSEYQPKDTLRTIPECNHYFHANCVDEWLLLNATCPLCRNTPESSVVTPCSSVSSSSLLSSSSSS